MGDPLSNPGQYVQFPQDPQYSSYVPTASRIPPTVQRAVLLMRIGAGVKGLEVVLFLALDHDGLTPATLIGCLLGVGLWLWMAASNQDGNNWARVTGTVFFGLASLGLVLDIVIIHTAQSNLDMYGINIPSGVYGLVACDIGSWLIGLITVILIWQKVSSAFYNPPMTYGGGWGVPGAPVAYPPQYQQYPQGAYYPQAPGYPAPYQQGVQPNPYQQPPGQGGAPVNPTDPWATPNQ